MFDVREPAKFERSHVRGAHRIAPDTKGDAFEKGFGDKVKGKHLVFYCSVDYRSSVMAERVRDSAMAAGAVSVANLRGGVFRWYNEGRIVHDAIDTTDATHPYDRVWGAFVNERPGAPVMTPATPDGVAPRCCVHQSYQCSSQRLVPWIQGWDQLYTLWPEIPREIGAPASQVPFTSSR